MVSHSRENGWAFIPTFGEWRTKVRGKEAQDIPKRHLEIMYLIDYLRLVERTQILMAPGMRGYLFRSVSGE